MPKLQVNPIVLIVINILAPSMYIFLNGSFLKIYLVIFATVLLLAMGCYKIFWGKALFLPFVPLMAFTVFLFFFLISQLLIQL